jgi:cyclopropane-fatty-acyl-phospholipid synthase
MANADRHTTTDDARGLLESLPPTLAFALPDGQRLAPSEGTARATIVFRSEAALTTLLGAPSLAAFGEAFVAGEVDVEGDLLAALEAGYEADALTPAPVVADNPRPPDEQAIRHHYDLPAEFFRLFLDRRMVYSCAYHQPADADLDEAQEAKLDLICRKLGLAAGDRLLDVGCGWGALTAWATEHYDAVALGVTLSRTQATWASRMLAAAGLGARARVEYQDYRAVDGTDVFHKIAAVGVIEHVGVANYPAYFAHLYRLLRPGGILLNHGITHTTPGRHSTGMTFLTRHVFPGAEFERMSHVVGRMEQAGFRILDVESLGGHYAATTAAWLARLQARSADARTLVGERAYRTWIAYLAAATVAFRADWIDLHQVVARRPDATVPREPECREHWYRLRER